MCAYTLDVIDVESEARASQSSAMNSSSSTGPSSASIISEGEEEEALHSIESPSCCGLHGAAGFPVPPMTTSRNADMAAADGGSRAFCSPGE